MIFIQISNEAVVNEKQGYYSLFNLIIPHLLHYSTPELVQNQMDMGVSRE
jgi:hypothetical protein